MYPHNRSDDNDESVQQATRNDKWKQRKGKAISEPELVSRKIKSCARVKRLEELLTKRALAPISR